MPFGEALKAAMAGMSSSPLAIALLMVNVAFLVFVTMLLHDVAENATTREKTQSEIITKLIAQVQTCKS